MQIEVIKTDVENKGKYRVANVAYKNSEGKVEGKKIVSFGPSSDVFKVIAEAQSGDMYEVKSEKIDGYWNWTGIESAGKAAGGTSGELNRKNPGTLVPRSTYETPEERAKKQVYIVRQSSISSAIEFLKAREPKGLTSSSDEVIAIARLFERFVFNTELEPVEVV